jgi:hypothetical protein
MATKQNKRYPQFVVDPLSVDPQTIADKLVFDPITKVESGTPFYTSKIHIQDPNTNSGKVGDLVLRFDTCDSFGISADVFGKPGVKDWNRCGMYTIMYNKADGKPAPTKRQVNVVDTIEKISEKCVDFIFNNRSVILKDCLNNNARISKTDSKFAGISPFKYRVNENTNEEDREAGPTMIQKIISFKPKRKGANENDLDGEEAEFNADSLESGSDDGIQFATKFVLKTVGENGKAEFTEINPRDYEKQRCRITTFVKVESIFMNSSMFKLQLKTKEVIMEVKETNTRKRLYEMFDDIMEANESSEESNEAGETEETEETQEEVVMEEVAEPEPEPILEEVPAAAPSKPKKKKTT